MIGRSPLMVRALALVPQGGRGVLPWQVPAPAVAALVASGLLFNGYDSTAGQAWCCLVNTLLFQALLLGDGVAPGFWRRAAPVLALGAAGLGWAVAATVAGSGGLPDYAPGKILSIIAGWEALMAGAIVAGRRDPARRAVLDWLLGLIAADLALGLALRGADAGLFSYWTVLRDGRFQGTVGNINVTAAMAGAGAVIACHRLLAVLDWPAADRRRLIRLGAYGVALLLCAGVVLLTASRVPSLLLLVALAQAAGPRLPRRRWRFSRRQGIVAGTTSAVLLVLGARMAGLLGARFDQAGAGWADRVTMWTHYAGLALDRPLTGYGLGSFPSVNAHFLTDPRFAQATWANNSPHDVVLQLMLGGGLPYAAATLAAVAVAVVATARLPRAGHRPDRAALIAAVALIAGCAAVDVVLDMPASAGIALFLAGNLWGDVLRAERNPRRRGGFSPSGA